MKKSFSKFALLITLSIVLFSCNKDPLEFTIKGNIEDKSFSTGLEGGKLTLTAVEANTGDTRIIGEATLPATGDYEFTFLRERDVKFYLTVEKDNYYSIDETIFFSELSTENENIYDYSTTAKSYINFIIKNLGTQESDDELKLEIYGAKTNCENCCGLGQQFFYGPNVDTSFLCANDGNEYYKFIYWVPNASLVVFDSIITTPFDTIPYEIQY